MFAYGENFAMLYYTYVCRKERCEIEVGVCVSRPPTVRYVDPATLKPPPRERERETEASERGVRSLLLELKEEEEDEGMDESALRDFLV